MTTPPPLTSEQVTDSICAGLRPVFRPVDLSPDEAHEKASAYRASQVIYCQHTAESLARGDYRQTAEKSWGAYAQTVKAIAADHRLLITTHGNLLRAAHSLTNLAGQADPNHTAFLTTAMGLAHSLHTHFYENDLPVEAVAAYSDRGSAAIDLLQRLFPVQAPRQPVQSTVMQPEGNGL